MRRKFLALLFACTLATTASGPAIADLGGFSIESFDADLTILPNAQMNVEERIDVEFQEPRHGIYRTIPVRYTDPAGYQYSLGFRLLDVSDGAGGSVDSKVSQEGQYVKIRLGSADRTVSGPFTYVLRYRIENGLVHLSRHDEVYWNVTGNEWNQGIARAGVTLHLPKPYPPDSLVGAAYTGAFGEQGHDAEFDFPSAGEVHVQATRPLGPLEGLTVAVAWPHGAVTFPTATQKALRFLSDNIILLAPLVVLAGLWLTYRRRGRDPRAADTIMVRYEPPQNLTPAEIGTMVDEKVDLRDITSTLIDLAIRGWLAIEEQDEKVLGLFRRKDYSFVRGTGKDGRPLLPHEQKLLDGFFESGDQVELSDLNTKFYRHIPGIRSAVYKRLVQQKLMTSDPSSVRARYVGYGVLAMLIVLGLGLLWVKVRGGVFPNAIGVPILSAVLSFVPFLAFAPAMPQRTRRGVEARAWALGFEEFVDRVEREKLEAADARTLFEKLLPYAMALGVSSRWAKRFEGIYDRPPSWYRSGSFTTTGMAFSTGSFEQGLTSAMSRTGSCLLYTS
ncbi:MAG: DUF2207 domain-containing protein, partial [Candidatus Eisenbacteria bacterium]|nr:DUF2207 domain-containing protein [Candidatus Eisenbacteria bacterium]